MFRAPSATPPTESGDTGKTKQEKRAGRRLRDKRNIVHPWRPSPTPESNPNARTGSNIKGFQSLQATAVFSIRCTDQGVETGDRGTVKIGTVNSS